MNDSRSTRGSNVKIYATLLDHEDLPQVLPSKLVITRKPDNMGESSSKNGARAAADQAKADWLAKVRMVVCGNYEHVTSGPPTWR